MGTCCSQSSMKNDVESTENLRRNQPDPNTNAVSIGAVDSSHKAPEANGSNKMVKPTSQQREQNDSRSEKSFKEEKKNNSNKNEIEPEEEKIKVPTDNNLVANVKNEELSKQTPETKQLTPKAQIKNLHSNKEISVKQIRENLKKNI